MKGKAKEFKIQRKKLIISKDRKDHQGNSKQKNLNFREGKEAKAYNEKRGSLNIKTQNIEFRRRLSSRPTFFKNDILPLEKKSTAISSPNQNPPQIQQVMLKAFFDEREKENKEQIRLVGRNPALEGLITELIGKLKQKSILFHCQVNSYLIEKNYFVHIFEYLICTLSTRDRTSCNRLFHNFPELKDSFLSIYQYCESFRNKQKSSCLAVNRNVLNHEFVHQLLEKSIKNSMSLIEYYTEIKTSLSERLKQLNGQLLAKQNLNDELALQINHKNLFFNELCLKISTLQRSQLALTASISSKQAFYQNLSSEIKKIENYGCDHREMIRIVSKDYKEIESDIYEYAVYLQSNELASKLDYEPHPFTQIEKTLMQEYSELEKQMKPCAKERSQGMRRLWQFCERLISFYSKRDLEMGRLGEFKTKCIRQFIQHMKKWLANWELKQEFLVNLRNQFAMENQNMHKALKETDGEVYLHITEVYDRIEENYKLGNSFY